MPGYAIKPGETITVLPSATYTAAGDQTSLDIWYPRGARGTLVIVNITGVGGSPGTITGLKINAKIGSDAGGAPIYKTVYSVANLVLNSISTFLWLISPAASQGGYDAFTPGSVPSQFQIAATTKDGNSITFSGRINNIGE